MAHFHTQSAVVEGQDTDAKHSFYMSETSSELCSSHRVLEEWY